MIPANLPPLPGSTSPRDARLRDAAERLEAGFLKEMLSAAGLGRAPSAFGGSEGGISSPPSFWMSRRSASLRPAASVWPSRSSIR